MVYLKNENLSLEISERGAEILKAADSTGRDIIWIGDPEFWSEHAPVLFPTCGSMLEDSYTYKGEKYSLSKHGFAKRSDFTVESADETSAVFLLTDSEEIRKIYPFRFELRIKYTLDSGRVTVCYTVDNTDDKEVLFSIGAHEGYMCKKVEDCYLEFDKPTTLRSCKLSGPYLNGDTEPVIENSRILPLKSDSYWSYDLIFKDIDFNAVTLKNKDGQKIVRAEFDGFPNLLVWSLPNSPYVCIEPWCGLPDYTNHDGNFETKAGLVHLAPGKRFEIKHSFEVE